MIFLTPESAESGGIATITVSPETAAYHSPKNWKGVREFCAK